jgi:hypothetical protein
MSIVIMRNKKKAQTILEYAMVIAVAVGVLLVMHNYLNRSLQGRLKAEIDKINPGGDYTLIDGRGTQTKTTVGVVWEHKKGHTVNFSSNWQNDNFSYNLNDQVPDDFFENYFQNCEGAECDLSALSQELEGSLVGQQATACMEGDANCRATAHVPGKQQNPTGTGPAPADLGTSGTGYSDIDQAEVADMESLYAEVGSDSGIKSHVKPEAIDPDSVDSAEAVDGIVDEGADRALGADSAGEWARPLLEAERED